MAVTAITWCESGGNASGSATTGAFTPPANTRIFAFVACRHGSAFQTINTPTDSLGGTWTEVEPGVNYDGPSANAFVRGKLFYSDIGGSPSSMTVTGTTTTGATTFVMVAAVASDSPLSSSLTVASGNSAAGDPGCTISGTPAAVLGFTAHQLTNNVPAPSGYTSLVGGSAGLSLGGNMRGTAFADTSSPGTTPAVTSTNVNSIMVAIDLVEGGGAAGQPTMSRWGQVPGMGHRFAPSRGGVFMPSRQVLRPFPALIRKAA